jgi:hypothetical protein
MRPLLVRPRQRRKDAPTGSTGAPSRPV